VSVRRRHRRRREPARAAGLLPRIPAAPTGAGQVDLVAAWHQLGARAAGAIPIRMSRNSVVTIACSDAMRAQQIQADADVLREELSRLAGISVTRLDTVVADHAVQMPEFEAPSAGPVPAQVRDAAAQVAEGMTAGIEDPELRDVLARAAAGAIARRWDQTGAGRR